MNIDKDLARKIANEAADDIVEILEARGGFMLSDDLWENAGDTIEVELAEIIIETFAELAS